MSHLGRKTWQLKRVEIHVKNCWTDEREGIESYNEINIRRFHIFGISEEINIQEDSDLRDEESSLLQDKEENPSNPLMFLISDNDTVMMIQMIMMKTVMRMTGMKILP